MPRQRRALNLLIAMAAFLLSACKSAPFAPAVEPTKVFGLAERSFVSAGRNPYFVLESGYQLTLEDQTVRLVILVLNETRLVAGVTTRVVEEREWRNGELIEVSRNFFAIDERTKDVFYFGEEVDNYQGGRLVNHSGRWLAGENGATPGLIMSGQPKLGMKYFQEVAPGAAMDFATVIALDVSLQTPAGLFTNCLKTEEGTALNPSEKEFKVYAPGIGLIQDANLLLTRYGPAR